MEMCPSEKLFSFWEPQGAANIIKSVETQDRKTVSNIYAYSKSRQIPNQFNGYTEPDIVQFILFLRTLRRTDWSIIMINAMLLRSTEHEARDSDAATSSHRRDWEPDKTVSAVYLRRNSR
jgi:hypothetical protein